MTREEQVKDFYRGWLAEVNNTRNADVVEKYMAADFVEHTPGLQGQGVAAARQSLHYLFTTFPNAEVIIEDVVADGDNVASRLRVRGTHAGEFLGIAPTDEPIDVMVMEWGRVRDDQWVEHWLVVDALSVMHQLGFVIAQQQTADAADM